MALQTVNTVGKPSVHHSSKSLLVAPVTSIKRGNRQFTSNNHRKTVVSMASDAAAACTAGQTDGSTTLPAEAIVQKQLEAYNARDLESFLSLMSDDCLAKDAVTGAVMAQGKHQLRQRYQDRFQTQVHSELLGRLCLGDVVVDREIITGLPDGAVADCLATYHCQGGKICRMEFVWRARS